MYHTRLVALIVCGSGLILSGCAESAGRSSPTARATGAAGTGAPAAPAASSGTLTSAAATCTPAQLQIAESGSGSAAGTAELTFSLHNTAGPCAMRGYPGVRLLGPGGTPQPTRVVQGGGLAFEKLPVTTVLLERGEAAYFNVGFSDVGPTLCVSASSVEVTPPDSGAHAVVAVSPSLSACNGGELDVSPVFTLTVPGATQSTAPPSS